MTWQTVSSAASETTWLGELLGAQLNGGEVIELVADLGGGKTTFTQGLARGLGSHDNASSPTFTLSKIYKCRDGLELHHFDFYRLSEPGIIADQLSESANDKKVITIVEWSDIVKNVLPDNRITVEFAPTPNNPDERQISFIYPAEFADQIRRMQTMQKEIEP